MWQASGAFLEAKSVNSFHTLFELTFDMEFRSKLDKAIWHFSPNCTYWPNDSFNILRLDQLPNGFNPCPECQALTVAGNTSASDKTLNNAAARRINDISHRTLDRANFGLTLGPL